MSDAGMRDPVAPARPNRSGLHGAVRVVLQVGVIVGPVTMSMNLIRVIGVIAVLTV